jgi:hypothetical protein
MRKTQYFRVIARCVRHAGAAFKWARAVPDGPPLLREGDSDYTETDVAAFGPVLLIRARSGIT